MEIRNVIDEMRPRVYCACGHHMLIEAYNHDGFIGVNFQTGVVQNYTKGGAILLLMNCGSTMIESKENLEAII